MSPPFTTNAMVYNTYYILIVCYTQNSGTATHEQVTQVTIYHGLSYMAWDVFYLSTNLAWHTWIERAHTQTTQSIKMHKTNPVAKSATFIP